MAIRITDPDTELCTVPVLLVNTVAVVAFTEV